MPDIQYTTCRICGIKIRKWNDCGAKQTYCSDKCRLEYKHRCRDERHAKLEERTCVTCGKKLNRRAGESITKFKHRTWCDVYCSPLVYRVPMEHKTCPNCGIQLSGKPFGNFKKTKFCSLKCYHQSKTTKRQNVSICKECGNRFDLKNNSRSPTRYNIFCSQSCATKNSSRKPKPHLKKTCLECGREFIGRTNKQSYCDTCRDVLLSDRRNRIGDGRITRWRNSVFKRDNYTCQICGKRGGELNAHHIFPFKQHSRVRYLIPNGITLCVEHHNFIHNMYKIKAISPSDMLKLIPLDYAYKAPYLCMDKLK